MSFIILRSIQIYNQNKKNIDISLGYMTKPGRIFYGRFAGRYNNLEVGNVSVFGMTYNGNKFTEHPSNKLYFDDNTIISNGVEYDIKNKNFEDYDDMELAILYRNLSDEKIIPDNILDLVVSTIKEDFYL